MSLCGQRDTEDDGRNACEFFCLTQQIVECQAIYVGEMILQENRLGLICLTKFNAAAALVTSFA